jgi:hypothetical protein
MGICWSILDGPYAKQYVWMNVWVNTAAYVDKEGVERIPTNWMIRKLQHFVDPNRHPDPETQKIQEGEQIEITLEDAEFFMGYKAAIEVEHGTYRDKKTNEMRRSVNAVQFRRLGEAAELVELTKSRIEGDDSSFNGPWDDEGGSQEASEDPDDDLNTFA